MVKKGFQLKQHWYNENKSIKGNKAIHKVIVLE